MGGEEETAEPSSGAFSAPALDNSFLILRVVNLWALRSAFSLFGGTTGGFPRDRDMSLLKLQEDSGLSYSYSALRSARSAALVAKLSTSSDMTLKTERESSSSRARLLLLEGLWCWKAPEEPCEEDAEGKESLTAAGLFEPVSRWRGVTALLLSASCSSSTFSEPMGEPTLKSSPKALWKRGLTDLTKEGPLRVLSFTLNIDGLFPKAGEEVLERDGGGAGDGGACGL